MAAVDDLAIKVLEVLEQHGGTFFAPSSEYGHTLYKLTAEVFGDDRYAQYCKEYHQVTIAVRYLEQIDLVRVDRASGRDSYKANIVERITAL